MTVPVRSRLLSEDVRRLADGLPPILALCDEIAAVYLFGSVARGDARPDSNLDLGIVFRRRGATALDHLTALDAGPA